MKLTYNNSKKSIVPNNFGFHDKEPLVNLRDKEAITEWFNYKGLTYIAQ